ncbi:MULTISPECIES: Sec-independent protein translocase protein TatB [unclassified Gordonia (in: high G+C Gram-positive bacteria)]|jgi:sec-independent protein translocase protein TatB|uniref:Sec-independent protein translocase protein TatB n=1 Tax=Gordonia TaxID=2053 RepID=UPI00071D04DC|nr:MULTISPECIES: Sec-independent protein translocase protein TatB [unclassified Gordonia (in: high G+C Gram-positive bacteria)]OCW88084.1 twin arginine-targeting protein translocase TatB [Nocardia farcinica]KSU56848.1 preprotein translocase subunit TatA [Gordonia sp. SGD-V-85]MBN0973247.1 Sec-independent protein translocase subunit TatB [Gordonia sp. BP-119]MBN0983280.1 Sec-independent protein translocase subunit TatB [Gordonia sp. BP-94]MBR7190610.1 Sec-independent protein translocase subunit
MFSSIGWGEIAILVVAALVILGPERLPGAVSWTMQSAKKVRDYATGASNQLKDELGPEFDDLRKPLADLNELRGMTPRSIVTKHLLDGDDSLFRLNESATTVDRKTTPAAPEIKPVSAPLSFEKQESGNQDSAGPAGSAASDRRSRSGSRPAAADWDAT